MTQTGLIYNYLWNDTYSGWWTHYLTESGMIPCRKERKGGKERKKEGGCGKGGREGRKKRRKKKNKEKHKSVPPHFHLAAKLTSLPSLHHTASFPGTQEQLHGHMTCALSQHPALRRAPYLVSCSAIAVLKNLNFWAMKLKLSFFALGPTY